MKNNKKKKWSASNSRSLFKTISWRIIATGTTGLLAAIFFRNDPNVIHKTFSIMTIEVVAKMLFYYIHERVWNKIKFGRIT